MMIDENSVHQPSRGTTPASPEHPEHGAVSAAEAAEPRQRPPVFPPRLEIAPLTIRRVESLPDERLAVC